MSTRALGLLALLLAVLLAGSALLALDRLGWLADFDRPSFRFENPLLVTERFERVRLRKMQEGQPEARYTFTTFVTEPAETDPFSTQPHVRAGVESRAPTEEEFFYEGEQALLLRQLGAFSTREWLEEIRPVEERLQDGSVRIRVRATYGHQSGGNTVYFHDPDQRVPGFGWIRQEFYAEGALRHVLYASDAGRVLLEEPAAGAGAD